MRCMYLLCFVVIIIGCSNNGDGSNPQPTPTPTPFEKLYPEWTEIRTDLMPPARDRHAMAYDSDKQVILLFGGRTDSSQESNDTWMYDGIEWIQLHPKVSPRKRFSMNMDYDLDRKLYVMTGAEFLGPDPLDLETWEFSYDTWYEVATEHRPVNRCSLALAYHPVEKCTYLFGGSADYTYPDDLWRYDGTDWTLVETEHSPRGRRRCEMVYDSSRNCLVLFGGDRISTTFNDTWEYNGTDWKLIATNTSPSPRSLFGLTYDKSVSLTILFGGYHGTKSNDTWAYDGTDWRLISTEICPEKRTAVMVYNEALRESFLFSGFNENATAMIEDQWAFRYTSDRHNGAIDR
jgi:hypothetical protein